MTILLDVNVVLDVFLARAEWVEESARVLDAAERKRVHAHVAGHTVTTAYYVTRIATNRTTAAGAVSDLLRICDVVPVDEDDFHRALTLDLPDFEDAVQVSHPWPGPRIAFRRRETLHPLIPSE